MTQPEIWTLAAMIFVAATLYSSVGHAGASGYLAAMALFGLAPDVMKPVALTLNILVATITFVRFHKAGCFSWSTFWPFALGSVPFAFVGGGLQLPTQVYRPVVGVVLLCAAFRLARPAGTQAGEVRVAPVLPAVCWGAAIGMLSGLTGTGGGIFLSPVLLFARWAEPRQTGGVAAAFILVNSVAGLAGRLASLGKLPPALPLWAAAALAGGLLGAGVGSRKLAPQRFRQVLAAVLVVAGLKLLLS